MRIRYLLAVFSIAIPCLLMGQTISADFELPLLLKKAEVRAIKFQTDGKMLLGGQINIYNGLAVNNLIRLNADHSIDNSFNYISDRLDYIKSIEVQNSGEVIISDDNILTRLFGSGNVSETIDTLSWISSVYVQVDDKVLVTGRRASGDGFLYRYNADLSADNTFKQDNIFNGIVTDVEAQNGKFLVAGYFDLVNGEIANDIVRISTEGTIDSSFSTGEGTEDYIGSISVQDDGKILLGRSFINSFNGIRFKGIARLNHDGSVDENFNGPDLNGATSQIIFQDGKALFVAFLNIGEQYGSWLVRLNIDGTLDETFTPVAADNIQAVTSLTPSSRILMANSSKTGNPYGFSLFDPNGVWDGSFNPIIGTYGEINSADFNHGQLVVGGDFIGTFDEIFGNVIKVNLDGSIDRSFKLPDSLIFGDTKIIPWQITVAGPDEVFVADQGRLLKLHIDGRPYSDFVAKGVDHPSYVTQFEVLEDGSIVTASPNGVFKLKPDGTSDPGFIFEFTGGAKSTAHDLGILSTGEIIYGNMFTEINQVVSSHLVKTDHTGSVDLAFSANIGSGPTPQLEVVYVLPNDEILVGGLSMSSFNNISTEKRLGKLSADGQFDNTFYQNFESTLNQTYFAPGSIARINGQYMVANLGASEDVILVDINGNVDPGFEFPEEISFWQSVTKKLIPLDSSNILMLGLHYLNGSNLPTQAIKLSLNNAPVIIGYQGLISTAPGKAITITIEDVLVNDSDNDYPNDFTLNIKVGEHYTLDNNTIIPEADFHGILQVPIYVNDGMSNSEDYILEIEVSPVAGISITSRYENIVTAFPNPTDESIFIRSESAIQGSVTLRLTDLSGNIVYKSQLSRIEAGEVITLSIPREVAGILILSLDIQGQHQIIKRVIVN